MNKQNRPLTRGETEMAAMLFGDALDYARVRLHNRPYLWFGLQPRHVAIAPNGEIYFYPETFRADFSVAHNAYKHWFIHEMVHVWQHQLGYPVKWRGALRVGLDYAYRLAPDKQLGDYNMEAQGDLLADYFALKYLADPRVMAQRRYAPDLLLYETVLAGFLADPRASANRPGRRRQA